MNNELLNSEAYKSVEYYLINKGIFGLENVSEQTQNLATIILKVRQTLF